MSTPTYAESPSLLVVATDMFLGITAIQASLNPLGFLPEPTIVWPSAEIPWASVSVQPIPSVRSRPNDALSRPCSETSADPGRTLAPHPRLLDFEHIRVCHLQNPLRRFLRFSTGRGRRPRPEIGERDQGICLKGKKLIAQQNDAPALYGLDLSGFAVDSGSHVGPYGLP